MRGSAPLTTVVFKGHLIKVKAYKELRLVLVKVSFFLQETSI